jgi:hypothetical protein
MGSACQKPETIVVIDPTTKPTFVLSEEPEKKMFPMKEGTLTINIVQLGSMSIYDGLKKPINSSNLKI